MRTNFCAVTRDLNSYQGDIDEADALEAACEAKVAELLARDDYAPTDAQNLAEVLYEMSEAGDERFQRAIEAGDFKYAIDYVLIPAAMKLVKRKAHRDAEVIVTDANNDFREPEEWT